MSNVRSHVLTAARLETAMEYVEWLRVCLHEKPLSASLKSRAAVACLGIAQEHHHSIALLIDNRLNGSAYALLRSAFEAYVRGMWLAVCATDAEVNDFWAGQEPPSIGVQLRALDLTPYFTEQVLSDIKQVGWSALCDFAHTGGLQVQRWNTETSVEPSYDPAEVVRALYFAETIGTLAVIGVASVMQDDALAASVLERFKAVPREI